jgi:hypothetical protein
LNTFSICGYVLVDGQFSTYDFETISNGGQLFILLKPVFYLSKDGRLFQIPHGAQSDGISAPKFAAAFGREAGGNDWAAGWFHDGVYRGWLQLWDGSQWVKARLSEAQGDDFLYECAIVCGDTESQADVLYWAVTEFGKRFYNPSY